MSITKILFYSKYIFINFIIQLILNADNLYINLDLFNQKEYLLKLLNV